MNDVYIIAAKRTPVGILGGQFSTLTSPKLGMTVLKAVLEQSKIPAEEFDEVIMGNVITAAVGQNPARQASMGAGFPLKVGATTVNKVCGSGMRSIMLANDAIKAGTSKIVAAGGMECMSAVPHAVNLRNGARLGAVEMQDLLLRDGIDNADGGSLGLFTEEVACQYGLTREMLDEYSIESTKRLNKAQAEGKFITEIAAVEVDTKTGKRIIDTDEKPGVTSIDKIRNLPAAFKEDGRLTAGTASGFADGAAVVVLVSEDELKDRKLTPIARIVAHAAHSQEPELFATAPIEAVKKVVVKAGWTIDEVDYFEINEALAPVPMTVMKELGISYDKMNVHGGALAIGHPLGASGARIIVELINVLQNNNTKRGVASVCIGGGEATAIAIELV